MKPRTVELQRVLKAKPEKVYRAFVEPDALARWLPPDGFTCTVHHLEAKVGGTYRMSFRNFTTGSSHAFGGTYQELEPGRRLRYTDQFEDPAMPDVMETTVELTEVSAGTEIQIVQTNLPEAIPADQCYLGWQDSIEYLRKLVEPEIPDGPTE